VANAALRVQPTEAMRAALARGVPSDSAGSRAGAGVQRGSASGQNGAGESGSRVVGAQRGMLWVLGADGVPAVVRVRTGLTDGQYTEISGPEVQEGMQVIAGVTGASAGAAQSASPNPFQGAQGNRGGPPRGF
jgi:HlyD family secretion protein